MRFRVFLCSEFKAEAGALFIVVVVDGFGQFLLCAGKDADLHLLLIRSKTALAESAAICPAS
jgi:hypothetical protein